MEAELGENQYSLSKAKECISIMCSTGEDIVSLSFRVRSAFSPLVPHLPLSLMVFTRHLKPSLCLSSPLYHPQIQQNLSLSLLRQDKRLLAPNCAQLSHRRRR